MKKKFSKFFIFAFGSLVIMAVIFGFMVAVSTKLALFEIFLSLTPTAPLFPKANILVLGVDDAYGHRSDTIMLLHTDPGKKEASVISIPRDTLVNIPGRGLDKVNHAYAYGGVELSRKTIEQLLNIEIPYYVVVDLSGIVKIIDDLGGVTLDVDKRMFYDDYAGDLHVNLQPGVQQLDGKQAMGYLRYRADGNDFTRIARQQKFLHALANEMLQRENLVHSPQLFITLLSLVDTNLSPRQTLGLGLGIRSAYELGQVYMTTIPGTDLVVDGVYYMKPDEILLRNAIRQLIYGEKVTS